MCWVRFDLNLFDLLIASIAILIGLLVPAVQRVRESANRTQTMNNLSQTAKAIHLAHDNNKKFPRKPLKVAEGETSRSFGAFGSDPSTVRRGGTLSGFSVRDSNSGCFSAISRRTTMP